MKTMIMLQIILINQVLANTTRFSDLPNFKKINDYSFQYVSHEKEVFLELSDNLHKIAAKCQKNNDINICTFPVKYENHDIKHLITYY